MILKDTGLGFKCYYRQGFSDEKVFKEIFQEKIYSKKKIGFEVESGETWLDLGANCGYFSQLALESGASVLAVDADIQNKMILEKLNTYDNYKGVLLAAVVPDDYAGDFVKFYQRRDKMTWKSSLFKVAKSVPVKIEAIKFSDLLSKFDGDICIKMDIEGAEIEILKKSPDFSRVKKMVFEWSFDKEPRMIELKKVLEGLKKQFKTVYCPINFEKNIYQNWRGAANQFTLVYCLR